MIDNIFYSYMSHSVPVSIFLRLYLSLLPPNVCQKYLGGILSSRTRRWILYHLGASCFTVSVCSLSTRFLPSLNTLSGRRFPQDQRANSWWAIWATSHPPDSQSGSTGCSTKMSMVRWQSIRPQTIYWIHIFMFFFFRRHHFCYYHGPDVGHYPRQSYSVRIARKALGETFLEAKAGICW